MTNPAQTSERIDITEMAATERLAKYLASQIKKGDVLALYGDLGAGKTCLARLIIKALGHRGEVPSPTFTLVQRYELPGLVLHHFDLYRLKSPDELEEIGWHDALAEGAVIVEWPERASGFLPASATNLTLTISNGERFCDWQKKKA